MGAMTASRRSRSQSTGREGRRRRHTSRSMGYYRSRSRSRRRKVSRSRSPGNKRQCRRGRWSQAPERGDKSVVGPLREEEGPLPVTQFKDELMDAIRGNQVLVCTGETGSGKTTQIPQYLLELERELRGETLEKKRKPDGHRGMALAPRLVGVTQPRRVAATSIASRVADERGCQVGEEVGYSIRFEDRTGPATRIKYMTDGVLVREFLEDPVLSRYGMIMLDEAHERSINTDILFGLLKRALGVREDLRAVVTSATLDVKRFTDFFGKGQAIAIPGRTYPVDIYHSKTRQVMGTTGPTSKRYIEDAIEVVLKIHRTQGPGHILAFFTGQEEIDGVCRLLDEAVKGEEEDGKRQEGPGVGGEAVRPTKLLVIPLYGALSGDAQGAVFRAVGPGVRKVVVATNIAETSVTVPGVRFVVDPGYVKQKAYDPARRMESLVVVPVSKVSAQQRAGRAGRTASGQCYRLYSKDCYGAMAQETVPEILRTNLANTLLYLKVLGVEDVLTFDFVDPPAEDQTIEALQHLYCLGALGPNGHATATGRRMSGFPLEPSLSRVLLEANDLGCLEEALTIVALLSSESIWYSRRRVVGDGAGPGAGAKAGGGREGRERGGDPEAEAHHARFHHPLGDHFTYLTVYKAWEASGFSNEWARQGFLRVRALRTAQSIRRQLLKEALKAFEGGQEQGQGRVSSCGGDLDKVRKAVCAGFFMNAGQRCSKEWVYRSLAVPALGGSSNSGSSKDGEQGGQAAGGAPLGSGLTLMYLHPMSSLTMGDEAPDHVVYTELVFTARPFMRHAMAVRGKWLRAHLRSVPPCSISELCGRPSEERGAGAGAEPPDAGDDGRGEGAGEGTAGGGGRNGMPRPKEDKAAAVAAARERFLARKRGSERSQAAH